MELVLVSGGIGIAVIVAGAIYVRRR